MTPATCSAPECDSGKIVLRIGTRKEPYCIEHVDYGMGRVFGPLHAMLETAQQQGIGVPPDEDSDR